MNGDDQLGELLLTWEERPRAGDEPSADELCNGDESLAAELERRITALKGTDWLFEEEGDAIEQTIGQSAEETKVVSPTLTVEEFTRSLSDSGLLTRDEVQQLQVKVADNENRKDAASLAERLIADGTLTIPSFRAAPKEE